MYHKSFIIGNFINKEHFIIHIMPKITIVKEKNGQIKYKLNLPKEVMESLAVKQGDKLNITGVMGEQITFKLMRV